MDPELNPEKKLPRDLEAELAEFMTRLASFCKKESTLCPYCLSEADSVEKIGRCVYILPCHHRLWAGEIPEAWIETKDPQ